MFALAYKRFPHWLIHAPILWKWHTVPRNQLKDVFHTQPSSLEFLLLAPCFFFSFFFSCLRLLRHSSHPPNGCSLTWVLSQSGAQSFVHLFILSLQHFPLFIFCVCARPLTDSVSLQHAPFLSLVPLLILSLLFLLSFLSLSLTPFVFLTVIFLLSLTLFLSLSLYK